jgi:hypothetical protein
MRIAQDDTANGEALDVVDARANADILHGQAVRASRTPSRQSGRGLGTREVQVLPTATSALGASLNESSSACRKMLPAIFEHSAITVPVMQESQYHQRTSAGAVPADGGVGYLSVAPSVRSEDDRANP